MTYPKKIVTQGGDWGTVVSGRRLVYGIGCAIIMHCIQPPSPHRSPKKLLSCTASSIAEHITQTPHCGHRISLFYKSQIHFHFSSSADFPHPIYQPYLFIKHLLNWYTPSDKEGNEQTERFWKEGSGYAAIQSTRPQTLGYSLADSPVGLLAWIYDKLRSWSDGYQWTDDESRDFIILTTFLLLF